MRAPGRLQPRAGGAVSSIAQGEVLFEIVVRGNAARCSAIDADTGVEVSVVGPADAHDAYIKAVALRKLRLKLSQR